MTPIKRKLLYIFRGSLLRLRITWNQSESLTLSVGYHVDRTNDKGTPKWSGNRCLPNTSHGPDKTPASVINRELELIEEKINRAFAEFELREINPTKEQIKYKISDKKPDKESLSKLIEDFLYEQSTLYQWSESLRRMSRQALDNLPNALGVNFRIQKIGEAEAVKVVNHMLTKKCVTLKGRTKETARKGLSNETVNRYIYIITRFVNWAIGKGFIPAPNPFKAIKPFKTGDLPVVYLTMEELKRFMDADLSDFPPSFQTSREIFCFGCFSGLRYSDIKALTWGNVKDNSIVFTTKKTHDTIEVELNDITRSILDSRPHGKTTDKVFDILCNSEYNETLQRIAIKAGIDSPVQILTYIGTQRIETFRPKYELISSHVARKTFVTNALSIGVPPQIVMKWTGHKTFRAMQPYIDIVSSAKKTNMHLFNSLSSEISVNSHSDKNGDTNDTDH